MDEPISSSHQVQLRKRVKGMGGVDYLLKQGTNLIIWILIKAIRNN